MTDAFAGPPFYLDDDARDWVNATFARLSLDEKVGQVIICAVFGDDAAAREQILALKVGGITRFFGGASAASELAFFQAFRAASTVPPFITADLEGSRMSLPFGTQVANSLALAAIDDLDATRTVARIIAEEAHAIGINWSFTPVADINAAFRSAIVATRALGSDVDVVERHVLAQVEAFQSHGIAATVKHWPGEGYDDRDQHLVTTVNPLSMTEWEATFGRIYRAAIDAGVMAVMPGHIAFPAFVRSVDPDAGVEAFRPASVSNVLNRVLLRERLGFNGLIISDATPMGGLNAWGPDEQTIPEVIANGCDVILFPPDPPGHVALLKRSLESGALPMARFEEAVMRVLAMKAALGLHREDRRTDAERLAALRTPANVAVADAITRRAPTLVKDTQNLLPLDLARHRRVLVISPGIVHPLAGSSSFALPEMLREEGFDVTLYEPGMAVTRDRFDLVLFLFGEETLLTRSHIFIDWMKLAGGHLDDAMRRTWHEVPTAIISFGYPYFLYDAPRVSTYVNAYATMEPMQRAVADALMGRIPWNRRNPVDPFCGLEDARY